jgi:hypothetical protein
VIPKGDFDIFKRLFCKYVATYSGISCLAHGDEKEIHLVECRAREEDLSRLPVLKFQIDSHVYTVNPNMYTYLQYPSLNYCKIRFIARD